MEYGFLFLVQARPLAMIVYNVSHYVLNWQAVYDL
jgi:hypothetical protein